VAARVDQIGPRVGEILDLARREGRSAAWVADEMAERTIAAANRQAA